MNQPHPRPDASPEDDAALRSGSDFAPTHSRGRRRWFLMAELLLLGVVVIWAGLTLFGSSNEPSEAVGMKVQLRNSNETVYLHKLHDGQYRFQVNRLTGPPEFLTSQQFAARVYAEQHDRGVLSRVLNITSPMGMIWVGLGLLGQVLFTGRMIVQWLASEKNNRSVVPPAFWWMSLVGATMLMVYFVWRKDAVGVLGQSAGWFIYVRNLWMIYNPAPAIAGQQADEPLEPFEDEGIPRGQPESAIGLAPAEAAPSLPHATSSHGKP